MTSTPTFFALAALALASGCYTSPKPEVYGPALSPTGIHGVLQARSGVRVSGELLEVRDSAYVMLVSDRVVIIPYGVLSSGSFDHQDWTTFDSFAHPSVETRQRLRWDSRFPFGMQDRAMAALLRAGGQSEPTVITAGGSP